MYRCKYQWIGVGMYVCIGVSIDGQVQVCIYGWVGVYGWVGGWMGVWMDGWLNEWIDGQMNWSVNGQLKISTEPII